MKRSNLALPCILLFLCLGALVAAAQDSDPPRRLEIVFGPRVGVSYILAPFRDFDASVQRIFPDDSRQYIPIFTQFGLNLEQRIRLGNTQSHFAFQEVLLVGGIDQNIVLPSLSILIGFRSRKGLEFGLGPNLSLKRSADDIGVGLSVVYSVGWTFSFADVFIPVDLAFVPTPSDSNPRFTLLTGFNFKQR
jgi:hypothetical protein